MAEYHRPERARIDEERWQAWAKKHWRHGPCPVCKAQQWGRGQAIGQIQDLDSKSAGTQPVYPLLPINCRVCGYTVLINPIYAGIMDGGKETPEAPPGEATPRGEES
jgi:hypothetical protein